MPKSKPSLGEASSAPLSTFLALYRGRTIGDARLIAVSINPTIVAEFAERLLKPPAPDESDPILGVMVNARQEALHRVIEEVKNA